MKKLEISEKVNTNTLTAKWKIDINEKKDKIQFYEEMIKQLNVINQQNKITN